LQNSKEGEAKDEEEKREGGRKLIRRCLVMVLLVAVVHDDIRRWRRCGSHTVGKEREKRKVRLAAEMRGGGWFFLSILNPNLSLLKP
jgi:hypothetical protein